MNMLITDYTFVNSSHTWILQQPHLVPYSMCIQYAGHLQFCGKVLGDLLILLAQLLVLLEQRLTQLGRQDQVSLLLLQLAVHVSV